jgi:hypothetical protein
MVHSMIQTIKLNPILARSLRYSLCDVGYTCYEVTRLQDEGTYYRVFFIGDELHCNSTCFIGTLSETEVTDFSLVSFDGNL